VYIAKSPDGTEKDGVEPYGIGEEGARQSANITKCNAHRVYIGTIFE
jgi:hypothetical protein